MDIVTIDFNHNLTVKLNQGEVTLSLRKTPVNHTISFGIDAPKAVSVGREESVPNKRLTVNRARGCPSPAREPS